ncbi:class III lanthionine synthetase LanKC [Nocardia sp. NPDC059691]|uniref:class III lanthionine synthetase LanKC n=1 Tax=Nocardia sp. NPDC059691 TaxID=3346908 RepID=UPI003673F3D2
MHDWEAIDGYRQFHPRWFESINRYNPGGEHAKTFRETSEVGWSLRRSGAWFVADAPDGSMPEQGWKLHISASTADTNAVLGAVIPLLQREHVTFKFLVDQRIASLVNGKLWPRGAAGKFMAIYPSSIDQFLRIGNSLCDELQGYVGPYILSDRRWPNSHNVFYRYGAFKARTRVRPDGMHDLVMETPDGDLMVDKRNPFWSPPEWAVDPFPATAQRAREGQVDLCDGRFTIESALTFSSRGGVYVAIDRASGEKVVLKEARPGVEIGYRRVDAVSVLHKEHRLLQALQGTDYFVRPVALFHEWEHAFLAEEFLPGDHLGRFSIRSNPIYWTDKPQAEMRGYLETMRTLWVEVAKAIRAAHERNIILADLSLTNIFVDAPPVVRIIDLESAFEKGVDSQVALLTPGISSARSLETNTSNESDDYSALGSIIFGSVMLATGIAGFHPPARRTFLRELHDDFALTDEFAELVHDLCANSTATTINLADRISKVPITRVEPKAPARTSKSRGDKRNVSTTDDSLRHRVEDACTRVVDYLSAVADRARQDRLFPADLMVYETNPCSVAYGAAGVIHAIHRMTGSAPDEQVDWLLGQRHSSEDYPPGLYVGQSGIAWVLAELGHLDPATKIMEDAGRHDLRWASSNLMHGSSGYGMACLKMWVSGAGSTFLDEARAVGERLRVEAQATDHGIYWNEAGRVRLGYLFGGSGIALFLLLLYRASGDPTWLQLSRSALEFELAQAAKRNGYIVGFPDEATEEPLGAPVLKSYWDIGTAGIASSLVRYLAIAPDVQLSAWLDELIPDICRKYAVFPQLFHGLAGLGNALLDIAVLAKNQACEQEAWKVAQGILLFGIERDEGLAFPGEQAIRESADFATGAAGVGLFLHRLLEVAAGRTPSCFTFVVDELLTT